MPMIYAPEPFQPYSTEVQYLCEYNTAEICKHFGLNCSKSVKLQDKIVQNTFSHLTEVLAKADTTKYGSDASALIAYLSVYVVNQPEYHSMVLAVATAYFFAHNNLKFVAKDYNIEDMFKQFSELKNVHKGFVPMAVIGQVMFSFHAFPELHNLNGERVWPVNRDTSEEKPLPENVSYPDELISHYGDLHNVSAILDDVFRVLTLAPRPTLMEDCKQAFIDTWVQLNKQE